MNRPCQVHTTDFSISLSFPFGMVIFDHWFCHFFQSLYQTMSYSSHYALESNHSLYMSLCMNEWDMCNNSLSFSPWRRFEHLSLLITEWLYMRGLYPTSRLDLYTHGDSSSPFVPWSWNESVLLIDLIPLTDFFFFLFLPYLIPPWREGRHGPQEMHQW